MMCPACVEHAASIAEAWEQAYPADIWPDPPPGQHGKTVDACAVRMARYIARKIATEIRACAGCSTP